MGEAKHRWPANSSELIKRYPNGGAVLVDQRVLSSIIKQFTVLFMRLDKGDWFVFQGFDKDGISCGLTLFLIEKQLKEFVFLIEIQGGKQVSVLDVMTEQYERFLSDGLIEAWDWRHKDDGLRIIPHNGNLEFRNGSLEYIWRGQGVIPPWK